MYDVKYLPAVIDIGVTGEKKFRQIEIDVSALLEEIPGGTAALVCLRPGETTVFRPTVTTADGILTWIVQGTDLGNEGKGWLQVEVAKTGDNPVVAKSPVVRTRVHLGL